MMTKPGFLNEDRVLSW